MAIDIDGFAVLHKIGAHSSTFADVAADAAKTARALVTKQLKAKTTTLKTVCDIRKALGDDAFQLILDGIPDLQIKGLLGRLDKYHPDLETLNAQSRRRQLSALAEGSAEPTVKPKGAVKAKAKKKAPAKQEDVEFLDFKSAGATRRR